MRSRTAQAREGVPRALFGRHEAHGGSGPVTGTIRPSRFDQRVGNCAVLEPSGVSDGQDVGEMLGMN